MSNYNAQINRAIVIVDRGQLARPDAEARLGRWLGGAVLGAAPPGQPPAGGRRYGARHGNWIRQRKTGRWNNGPMSAIILGWDPARWNRWNYAAVVEQVAVTGLRLEPWNVGRSVAAGTDVWLLLLGDHGPGLIGHGVVLSEPSERTGAARQDQGSRNPRQHGAIPRHPCRWHSTPFCPSATRSLQVLTEAMPGVPWDSASSGHGTRTGR